MAAGNVTTVTAANFIPEIWAQSILMFRNRGVAFADSVRRYDDMVASYGDVIHLPRIAQKTAVAKVPGTPVTFDMDTESESTITVTAHRVYPFLVEDIAKVQSKPSLVEGLSEAAGIAVRDAIEASCAILVTSASITQTAGSASTTYRLVKNDFLRAKRLLDQANVPQEDRVMILDPIGYESLLQANDFVTWNNSGYQGGLNKGQVPTMMVAGFKVIMSNQVHSASNIVNAIAMHKDAIGLAVQKDVRIQSEYSVDHLGVKVAADSIYGCNVIRGDHAVRVMYGATPA